MKVSTSLAFGITPRFTCSATACAHALVQAATPVQKTRRIHSARAAWIGTLPAMQDHEMWAHQSICGPRILLCAALSTPHMCHLPAAPQTAHLHSTQPPAASADHDGRITSAQAKEILPRSRLPQHKLAAVWGLADSGKSGYLGLEEFVKACELISLGQGGSEISDKAWLTQIKVRRIQSCPSSTVQV